MTEPAGEAAASEAFWAFSLELYARPGIAETCLALQDRHGLDVNIVLLCCWLGCSGRGQLSLEDLRAAEAGVVDWRGAVVEKLRAVRRALKTLPAAGAPALRVEVQRLELAAEREAQKLLLAALPPRAAGLPAVADAAANLALYLGSRGCAADLAAPLVAALRR